MTRLHPATAPTARSGLALSLATLSLLLPGCASQLPGLGHQADGLPPPPSSNGRSPPVACRQLAGALAGWPGLRITDAQDLPADAAGHPAHCLVRGRLGERTGSDGRPYAIGFELRLPRGDGQRLLHQPQDGMATPAYGTLAVQPGPDALGRGIAVLTSDGGHQATAPADLRYGLAAPQAYGADAQARRDLAHAADAAVWPLALALATRHYGAAPKYRYIAGCGEGGRRALMAASRHPDHYDGLLAGAPAMNLPRATLAQAWSLQSWMAVSADLRRAFTPAQLREVGARVLARCDALDQLHDGVVGDVRRCQRAFRFQDLQCPVPLAQAAAMAPGEVAAARQGAAAAAPNTKPGTRPGTAPAAKASPKTSLKTPARPLAALTEEQLLPRTLAPLPSTARSEAGRALAEGPGACLAPLQVQALQRAFGGPLTRAGEPLYAAWPMDPGIAGAQWRRWQLDSAEPAFDSLPLLAVLAPATLSQVMSTPPAALGDGSVAALRDYLARLDIDRDAPAIAASDAEHPESALALFTPPEVLEPRLASLARHGGKLLVYHGVADPVFSALDTLAWADRLHTALGLGPADEVARVFAVPGMNHCAGGPATDRFDALGALMDWVEQGRAPDRIEARVHPANPERPTGWSTQRSRPLCPWPRVARYAGGDVEAADSFRCAPP
ncbi:tannase/feruloyl esterase family alpha/beta hydrolase [Aquabacterium sp. OR-4]|uniref:tannase/feruloyl esterase family alpha/beta hydrolase n=1 Tax=Aquabacterium sp. OR-4 TaxID=2978127 RepID=UPI0028CA0A8E|nr:tannase/feruloyl esterase family alpha/beta hydrolase [Aquabacterium sp. OR-4]MDT7833714.1 tannase/feruloyl esterase family alpha/beta hydrolase [Aquabacterium sp. OR-4]